MSDYEEHASKVSAWRGGEFVVHPAAQASNCTVWFSTGPDGPDGLVWEGLLCRHVSDGLVQLCAIPFWLYDLDLGDEIATMRSNEGALVATGVERCSGNVTFRAILVRDDAWPSFMAALEPLECWFDVRTPTYIAISCAPDNAAALREELLSREARGELQYETGRGD